MSYLTEIGRAVHGLAGIVPADPTDAAVSPDLDAARADGFAAATKKMTDRYEAVRADTFISSNPDRLASALQLVATTSLSPDEIRAKVQSSKKLAARADSLRAAAQGETYDDPLAVADQPDASGENHGWSSIVAQQSDAGGAVASGGPFEPHSSCREDI